MAPALRIAVLAATAFLALPTPALADTLRGLALDPILGLPEPPGDAETPSLPATTVVELRSDGRLATTTTPMEPDAECGGAAPNVTACDAGLVTVLEGTDTVLGVRFPSCSAAPAGGRRGACFAGTITMELRPRSHHLHRWAPVTASCVAVAGPSTWALLDCGFQGELGAGEWALTCTLRDQDGDERTPSAAGDWRCAYANR